MQTIERRRSDFLASLVVPGWTQAAYFAPKTAAALFVVAVGAWCLFGWRGGVAAHLAASLHGMAVVTLHFSGWRRATPGCFLARAMWRPVH